MRELNWKHLSPFFSPAPLVRSKKIHPNFVFRFHHLGLSDQLAASSVDVDLEQVYRWDDGEEIPPLVRKVWSFESGRLVPDFTGFSKWSFKGGRIITPDGAAYTEPQLRHALFLLDQLR